MVNEKIAEDKVSITIKYHMVGMAHIICVIYVSYMCHIK